MNTWDTQEYLGDGIYVKVDGMFIRLMSDDNVHPTNTIWLNEDTLKQLIKFAKIHAEAWFREEGE